MKILRRIKDIISFEKLRWGTGKFVEEGGYLKDKNTIFIVNLPATDYYYLPYFQLYQYKNVIVNFSYVNSNKAIADIMRRVSKYSIYRKYLRTKYDESKDYVIFFDGQYTLCTNEFREILKEKFPRCKIIFHLGDLIETKKGIKIEDIKSFSDLVVTYDHNDADKYGLQYHPDPYSKLPERMLNTSEEGKQVIFFGLAKNRADDILGVYDGLKKAGVNSLFSIPDLNDEYCNERPELRGAHFTPYLDYLKRVNTADCLLEIIQKGSRGCTFRTWEAVVYNKKLITNNPSVKEESFYDPNYIQVIDGLDDIDVEWIKKDITVNYRGGNDLSPSKCFEFYLNELAIKKVD